MKRKIEFDPYELLEFIDAMRAFLFMPQYQKKDLLNMSRSYLVAKFITKLDKRLTAMLTDDRSSIKVAFDEMHIALTVDVLQRVGATTTTNRILLYLASSAPREIFKIHLPNESEP